MERCACRIPQWPSRAGEQCLWVKTDASAPAMQRTESRLERAIFGAGNEVRTRDLNLGKVALYQLSYTRLKMASPRGFEPLLPP